MRLLKEQVIDNLLLLHIVNQSHELGFEILGKLKLQKLLFLIEWALMKNGLKGLHYKFFRYNNGPFSKNLAIDYSFLVKNRNINSTQNILSDDGKNVLKVFLSYSEKEQTNSIFFKLFDTEIKKWGRFYGNQLMNLIYQMKIEAYDIPKKELKIKDIPTFCDILVPEAFTTFKTQFKLPDGCLEDFIYLLNLDEISRKKMRASSKVNYEQQFGSV